jgi:hypothetical protein
MLPLGAADPYRPNKVQAARYLRSWVHDRRAAVAAMTLSAATGRAERDGGSTLPHMPEMMVPYGLYVLGHHPDFPQVRLVWVVGLRGRLGVLQKHAR